jgi:hypothetical protein
VVLMARYTAAEAEAARLRGALEALARDYEHHEECASWIGDQIDDEPNPEHCDCWLRDVHAALQAAGR